MTSPWIKVSVDLPTHPKILQMADLLAASRRSLQPFLPGLLDGDASVTPSDVHTLMSRRAMRDVVIAAVLRVWAAANIHTETGEWRNVTLEMIDDLAEIPGFGQIMETVGWVRYTPASRALKLPNFLKNNTPAKARVLESDTDGSPVTLSPGAARQRRWRDRHRNASSNRTGDASETHREEAEQMLLSPSKRVGARVARRPEGWPTSEAQARSMAEAAGIAPEIGAMWFFHYESVEEWPSGSFAHLLKAKQGFQASDLARDKELATHKAKVQRETRPVTPPVSTTTPTKGSW